MNECVSVGSFPTELRGAGQAAGLTEKPDVPTSGPNLALPGARRPQGFGGCAAQDMSLSVS